jgi:rare lipoprotein A
VKVPPAPSVARSHSEVPPAPPPLEPSAKTPEIPPAPVPEIGSPPIAPDAQPIAVETGLASWYGAPYHSRRSSNGQVYDMNAMTAAHRTLPLGSIVRVTNLKTGHAAIVRITDRGPFVPGRVVDLSLAAAKKADVWQPGIARVRVEVLQTPTPPESVGRWAVQIGAFEQEDSAREMAGRLSQRYRTAKVLCFSSPVGAWWVRVRVKGDDKKRAQEVARENQTPEGSIFLVRLD